MVDKRKLSVREKVDYLPAFLSIGGTAMIAQITAPFRGSEGAATSKHHVAHALIRKFNSRLSSLQSQSFQPTFPNIYEKWCKSHNIQPEFVTTSTGLKGAWIGDKHKAKYVVVYYHGGGFALDGSEGHLDFWHTVQTDLTSNDISTAFFYVFYTLTPHTIYPTQLKEAVEAVQYVIEEVKRSPSEILLSGDSAGGNLAVSVLLHLTHPCPDVPYYTIDTLLRGLVLMAPWVSLSTDWPSFENNKTKDYLQAESEGRWAAEYVGTHPHDPYTDPATAPSEWWKDAKAEHVFVVVGSIECLLDGIQQWVDTYRISNPNITMVLAKDEVHIAPIVWPIFGDKHETEQAKAIKKWMKENLGSNNTTTMETDKSPEHPLR